MRDYLYGKAEKDAELAEKTALRVSSKHTRMLNLSRLDFVNLNIIIIILIFVII